MSLKELLQLKEVQDHFGITVKEEYPFRATLKFAEDMTIVGIDIDKNQVAVIPYHNGKIHNTDIREILLDYNIIDTLENNIEWDLECTWFENYTNYEEESEYALNLYAETYSILILEKKFKSMKLKLDGGVSDGSVSEMQ